MSLIGEAYFFKEKLLALAIAFGKQKDPHSTMQLSDIESEIQHRRNFQLEIFKVIERKKIHYT